MLKKSHIFVIVDSTHFDALVQTVDVLVPSLEAEGMMQIGHGQYTPVNLSYSRFASSLPPYYERASLVVAHGELATTTMEVLRRGLPLVNIRNPDRYDNHQEDLLSVMDEEGYLIWCRHLEDLEQAINTAQTTPLRLYQLPECTIHLIINEFLSSLSQRH